METTLSPNLQLTLAVLAGVITGFINVTSAGGSMVSLPVLMFLGLPAGVANATNRVAIFMQNVVATSSYYKKKELDVRGSLLLSIPATVGAVFGSLIAVVLSEEAMRRVIAVMLLVMLVSLFVKPNRWITGVIQRKTDGLSLKEIVAFFLVGLYGGFIQAGVGVFLLTGLVWASGYGLRDANPIKNAIALAFTVVVLVIFSANSLVNYKVGIALGVGNMAGAWLGVRASLRGGSAFIRYMLIVVVLFSSLKFLNVF